MKAVILRGPAGSGKTSLSEYISANILKSQYRYLLCHEWITAEEFTYSIHIPAVALQMAGMPQKNFYQKGILAQAVEISKESPITITIDELDKASTKIDALLLDFTQNCRVVNPNGQLEYGNTENIALFITTNEERDLIDPLQRRCLKVYLPFLDSAVETDLLAKNGGTYHIDSIRRFVIEYVQYEPKLYVSPKLQRLISKVATFLRSKGLDISLYEMKKLYLHIPMVAKNVEWAELLIKGWFCRNDDYTEALDERFKGLKNLANAILDLYWQEKRSF